MKRSSSLVILFTAMLLSSAVSAAERMRDVIVQMPDSVLQLLTKVNREDCVDFVEAGMTASVTNRFGGVTELAALTDDYALWHYTTSSEVEMRLLPVSDSTNVICLVHRVSLPCTDSSVHFYDSSWNPLRSVDCLAESPLPVEDDGLMMTRVYRLSPDGDALTLDVVSERYTSPDGDAALRADTTTVRFSWNGAQFVAEER